MDVLVIFTDNRHFSSCKRLRPKTVQVPRAEKIQFSVFLIPMMKTDKSIKSLRNVAEPAHYGGEYLIKYRREQALQFQWYSYESELIHRLLHYADFQSD